MMDIMTQNEKPDATDEDVEIMRRYIREPEGFDVQSEAFKMAEALSSRNMSSKLQALFRECSLWPITFDEDGFYTTLMVPIVSLTLYDWLFSVIPAHGRYQLDCISDAGYRNLLCSDFVIVKPNPKRGYRMKLIRQNGCNDVWTPDGVG
jgi:hypothetical protein